MSSSKLAIRQDMPPKGGYAPIHWKRYAPKRTIPGYFIFSAWLGGAIYCYSKMALMRFEQRVNDHQEYHIRKNMYPFIWAEQDRRMVRARKQHEEDLALIGAGTDWDCHRRTYAQEEVWTPWNPREMRVLLTDEERVALGGQPSRYSQNDLYQNYHWQIDAHENRWKNWSDEKERNAGVSQRELGPDGSDYQK
ncbi:NADH dehydrogenase [ubiquinone] 1 alpha subcomplex subunit 13-like [Bolinopsis microptera]|uniref:NADH dehydrogenase [ubiquinone] 1 alpha subcomplex subunit 13-like n=1 Tax=Bolinopsis microptera TaxID=2820187 RepID=UPI00307AC808